LVFKFVFSIEDSDSLTVSDSNVDSKASICA